MDRRVKKTQTAIRKAFAELIEEKEDANSVTIKEIVDRADISRSTFYTHYSDILDLTDDISRLIASDISDYIIKARQTIDSERPFVTIYGDILQYLYDRAALVKVLLVDMRNTIIFNGIADSLRDNMINYYRSRHEIHDEDILRGMATFWTNGLLGIIRDWANNDFNHSPEYMTDIMIRSIDYCANLLTNRSSKNK